MEVIASGSELTVTYVEPTTNKNGTPLLDLDHTSIFTTIAGVKSKVLDVPASAPTGGGTITQKITVDVGLNAEADVIVTADAADTSKNVSDPTTDPSKTVRIDNNPPSSPI